MSAKYHIKDLLRNGEFVWAPCVYDCVSAYCAELAGYNACLISSCELEIFIKWHDGRPVQLGGIYWRS